MNPLTNIEATPRCPHFGPCGGCQLQDISYPEQLSLKQSKLKELLRAATIAKAPAVQVHSAEPYEYRNRIRLRIERVAGELRFGYNRAGTTDFLPISTCPIAAPILIQTAEAVLALSDRDSEHWLNATRELELFTNDDLSRVQLTLFCAPRTKAPQGSFTRMMNALQQTAPQVAGASAAAFDPRTGPTGRTLAQHGAAGLNYRVPLTKHDVESFWITRGGFFQINRFLLPTLVNLVTADRSGDLAWDLFAGVGLFSRVLAQSFHQVTAVEASPIAAADLRAAFTKLSPDHTAVEATTLEFLRTAVLQRERPSLIVLDPPRAGAGPEACELLNRIAPAEIVYVSCDPATLTRDLAILQEHYTVEALHLLDLFPQTTHVETVAVLKRSS